MTEPEAARDRLSEALRWYRRTTGIGESLDAI